MVKDLSLLLLPLTPALHCVLSLDGDGKTTFAQCCLETFLEDNRDCKPRCIPLYCVPTQALRE
jgi:hypothetical protein